ncbi:unnamed protein product, partial [Gongylonema pulchrum]|uniref:SERPIN domain-containing protein n=1 Tax=Gongylonema pulchrum TaxID=637853 RepID=A0A183EH18_9BILA
MDDFVRFLRDRELNSEKYEKLTPQGIDYISSSKIKDIFNLNLEIYAEKPQKDIHDFVGTFRVSSEESSQDGSLNVENVLWANTVLASGRVVGVV